MQTTRLAQEQNIERYVLNKMSEDEATEFEAFFLSNQACLDQLELTEKLHQGLETMAENSIKETGFITPLSASNERYWLLRKIPAWSLAAALILAILPSAYLVNFNTENLSANNVVPLLDVYDIALATQRGAKDVIVIKHSTKQLVLSTYVDTEIEHFNFSHYEFVLLDQNGKQQHISTNLTLNNNSTLYINLGRSFLKVGEYQFKFIGIDNNNSAQKEIIKTGVLSIVSP